MLKSDTVPFSLQQQSLVLPMYALGFLRLPCLLPQVRTIEGILVFSVFLTATHPFLTVHLRR